MIAQVQGTGISTEQQKKNWLINWYFENDPMGSIYLATLRNPALVASYQTSPGMLYGSPFATGMENYFQKIRNHFGQSMFDQLLTEFAQQSNLYVDEIKVDEWHIYGSSRLGVYEANRTISKRVARDLNNDNQITNNEYLIETPEEVMYLSSSYQLERGAKRYELANHLGNVLTVISDKKTANFTGTTFTNFTAERISATDYSPFGAPLAGRTWNGGEYRYGFNSMEKDNEINGIGNAYDFGARIYDGRLGIWVSVDPLKAKYPWLTPYNYSANNPILYIDNDGKDYGVYINHTTKTIIVKATYFVTQGDADSKASAQLAVDYWNDESFKYQYVVGKGDNKIVYDIKFELVVQEAIDPSSAANKNLDANAYYLLPDNDPIFQSKSIENSKEEITNGYTDGLRDEVMVKQSHKKTATGSHELGHTLGIGHWAKGLMFWNAISRNSNTTKGLIGRILKNANIGSSKVPLITFDVENEDPGFRGKVRGAIDLEGVAPNDFCEGKVVENK